MLYDVIPYILSLETYIILSVGVGLVLWLVGLLAARKLTFGKKRIEVLGLFYQLTPLSILRLCVSCNKLIFIIWCIIFRVRLNMIHYVCLLVLFGLSIVIAGTANEIVYVIINGVMVMLGLTAGNILLQYNQEIRYEWTIETVYWLLGLFIALYTVYLIIGEISFISSKRRANYAEAEDE